MPQEIDCTNAIVQSLIVGFKYSRKRVTQCLAEGRIEHEARSNIDSKNLLLNGDVTIDQVIEILKNATGPGHSLSQHHLVSSITVEVLKTRYLNEQWYFIEPNCIFISVHK